MFHISKTFLIGSFEVDRLAQLGVEMYVNDTPYTENVMQNISLAAKRPV